MRLEAKYGSQADKNETLQWYFLKVDLYQWFLGQRVKRQLDLKEMPVAKAHANRARSKETVLWLEDAKEMTVGQPFGKWESKLAWPVETISFDKYIKQHRDEIEAGKFETQKLRIMEELAQQKKLWYKRHYQTA